MLKSMFSAISGLKTNQQKLDIIGNNIANVGTTAFKSQTIRFEDMMSQNSSQASGSTTNLGGTNAKQTGLGVQVASIDSLNTNGSMQPTSRPLDTAIDGAGYFVVKGDSTCYTRDGGFELDTNGNLTTSDGLKVMGYAIIKAGTTTPGSVTAAGAVTFVDANVTPPPTADTTALIPLVIPDTVGASKVESFTIEKDGVIKAKLADGTVSDLGQIAMASFKNEGGLTKVGKDEFQITSNSGLAVFRSGLGATATATATSTIPDNSKGYGDINQGMLEMSNVDLAQQFTDMIIASRAFQANGKVITTADQILQDLISLKQ